MKLVENVAKVSPKALELRMLQSLKKHRNLMRQDGLRRAARVVRLGWL